MYFAKAFSYCFRPNLVWRLTDSDINDGYCCYVSLLFICLFVYVLSSCSWRSHASAVDGFICFVRTEYKIFLVYEWHRNLPYVFFLSDSYIVCYAMTLSLTIFAGSCPCADGRDFRAVLWLRATSLCRDQNIKSLTYLWPLFIMLPVSVHVDVVLGLCYDNAET